MDIYIKAESIGDIEEAKLVLEVGGYDGKVYIIPTEKLRKQLAENNSSVLGAMEVKQIMGIDVLGSLIV